MTFSRWISLASAAVFLLSLSACGGKEPAGEGAQTMQRGDLPDAGVVVVTVNGTVITVGDVEAEVARLFSQFGGQVSPFQAEQMKEQINQQAKDNLISKILIYDAVKEANIGVNQDEVEERFAKVQERAGSDEIFAQQLESSGISEEKLKEEIGMTLQIEKLLDTEGNLQPPSDVEIREFYDANKGQYFTKSDEVHAKHILLTVDADAPAEEREAAHAQIAEIREECVGGGDFAALAKEHSKCPSASNGGDLGWFPRGRMVPPFEEAAFALEPGEISEVVETQFGYHIITIAERNEGGEVPFEEVTEEIESYLMGQKRKPVEQTLVNELREAAQIDFAEG